MQKKSQLQSHYQNTIFFTLLFAPPPSTEGGFLPLLLVGQEGGQHLLLQVGGVGREPWRRGGKTAN